MTTLQDRLGALSAAQLQGIRRGIEKESLRTLPDGQLALTPHPGALGSPLTHPHITTDFSESQLELVTGAHASVEAALTELREIHQVVCQALAGAGGERLWASSMPCGLPTDETIPLGRYGSSNIGRAKSVYRMGLGHRYGRRMQTISGIHYNWSLPGLDNAGYFGLIRNFRRHAFLPLYLFGASPAVCSCFVAGRQHSLEPLGDKTMHRPWATSLRMGRLGYQSDAQATLNVSYNSLQSYAASLQEALTVPYPPYEAIGIQNLGGDYNQLATTLLQIENEFYGTIRPKRVIRTGERPLHALRDRGVEYVEVRLMDLNPFEPLGINADTARFLDLFLLHCALSPSAPDTLQELHELKRNQHLVAERGREPGLQLERGGQPVALTDWAADIMAELPPLAAAMDAACGGTAYAQALLQAQTALSAPDSLPSARVLHAVQTRHGNSFMDFSRIHANQNHAQILALGLPAALQERFAHMARESVQAQKQIEAQETQSFEDFRLNYTSPLRLGNPG